MFAGLAALNPNRRITEKMRAEIRGALSRFPGERLVEYSTPNTFVVCANVGGLTAYPGASKLSEDDVSVLAGEPLGHELDPAKDHRRIHSALAAGSTDCLADSRGVFCGARCAEGPTGPSVELFADKLATRPIYYWVNDGVTAFATAERILEALSYSPGSCDEAGIVESVAFGYPLADRTRNAYIKVVRESEILHLSRQGISRSRYWQWDSIRSSRAPIRDAPETAYQLFKDSVARRLRDDTAVVAFLSGGMDSRIVVSALQAAGSSILAVNFSFPDSQDQVFAKTYAETVGIPLRMFDIPEDLEQRYEVVLARTLQEELESARVQATRPRSPWSGDGGSVGLGNVYLDDELIRLMRCGNQTDAIEMFFLKNHIELPLGVIRPNKRAELQEVLRDGIAMEIDRHECEDRAQALFLFLMANDQRRHLYSLYEDIDLHRLEYQLPFMDSDLLSFIFSLPVEYRNNHRFYTDLYQVFPEAVRAVPWQTYHGHVPCPLPIPSALPDQWARRKKSPGHILRARLNSSRTALVLAATAHSTGPVSRMRLAGAGFLQLAGLRDFTWTLRAAKALVEDKH